MKPADYRERERALCTSASFCVSAPAGSGKTSLLVKRFLKLLAAAAAPENIVAITFTRKAAAEMRARILEALQDAQRGCAIESEHELEQRRLAEAVLAQNDARDWDLLRNPARLRLQTIDSFCAELTRQMPVLSGVGGSLPASDDSAQLYRRAVQNFLQRESATGDAARRDDVERLLLHLDNDWEAAVLLLSGLLQRREQWQPVFGGSALGEGDRRDLRTILQSLTRLHIDRAREAFAADLQEIEELLDYRRRHLVDEPAFSRESADLHQWRTLVRMLLTKGSASSPPSWRARLTKNEGFPAVKGDDAQWKPRATKLLERYTAEADEHRLEALLQLRALPDAADDEAHWAVLTALTRLLPRLGAELLLVFQATGEVDHAQIAMGALAALGADSAPTELALRLDYRIDHLLVDEFQDTSSLQFELVRRLTRGWAEHAHAHPEQPRTLFVVGDPMQSIYGFREANVGLFIRARDEGIGDLSLESLELTTNFRSVSGLVNWVNERFARAMPREDDVQLGAVSLRPALAARDAPPVPELAVFYGDGAADAELRALCERVAQGIDDPDVGSIAILGRSRSQLRPVLAALRRAGIAALARDMDPLEQRPHVRDLVTLCTVLQDASDRFAWLSLLRCPAVALESADLVIMAKHAPTAAAFRAAAQPDDDFWVELSSAAAKRLQRVARLLAWADHYRDRLALRVWAEECWLRFGGAASLVGAADRDDVDRFFCLLEELDRNGVAVNAGSLSSAVEQLYASPGDAGCKLEVMTLHKAKGLEFDWVFIPALAKTIRGSDSELLIWDEFVLPGMSSAFMMDVRSSAEHGDEPRLYDYLSRQAKMKRARESTRLLYVGCTRAADYLWLGASLAEDSKTGEAKSPPRGSLLADLWPSLEGDLQPVYARAGNSADTDGPPPYWRLDQLPTVEAPPPPVPAQGSFPADNRAARALGTALHRCLEALVYRDELPDEVDRGLEELLRCELLEAGIDSPSLREGAEQCVAVLNHCLRDDTLRWMLAPERLERAAELPLTHITENGPRSLVIDYSFVDEARGERWIVDYKTASPADGESDDAFAVRQLETYAEQLQLYRQAIAESDPRRVRCALYLTYRGQLVELPGSDTT